MYHVRNVYEITLNVFCVPGQVHVWWVPVNPHSNILRNKIAVTFYRHTETWSNWNTFFFFFWSQLDIALGLFLALCSGFTSGRLRGLYRLLGIEPEIKLGLWANWLRALTSSTISLAPNYKLSCLVTWHSESWFMKTLNFLRLIVMLICLCCEDLDRESREWLAETLYNIWILVLRREPFFYCGNHGFDW